MNLNEILTEMANGAYIERTGNNKILLCGYPESWEIELKPGLFEQLLTSRRIELVQRLFYPQNYYRLAGINGR